MVILHSCLGCNFDARSNAVAIALHSMQCYGEPVRLARAAIHPQFCIQVHRRHYGIDAPVSIEISERTPAMTRRGLVCESRFCSESFPLSARAEISKDGIRLLDPSARPIRPPHMPSAHEQNLPTILAQSV